MPMTIPPPGAADSPTYAGLTIQVAGGAIAAASVNGEGATQTTLTRYSANAAGPQSVLRKARGTIAAPAAAAQNDVLGIVSYQGYSGASFVTAATLQVNVLAATPSDSNMQSRFLVGVCPSGSAVASAALVLESTVLRPGTDNSQTLGAAAQRYSVVYAGTSTINTSDAREKTAVTGLTEAELSAAAAVAREIGTFQFLDALAAKGEAARVHVGLTVQRAAEVLQAHGLEPTRYGFICFDSWEASPEIPGQPARPAVLDADGTEIEPAVPAIMGQPAQAAGDRWGFREGELHNFMLGAAFADLAATKAQNAALESRIAALESRIAALEAKLG